VCPIFGLRQFFEDDFLGIELPRSKLPGIEDSAQEGSQQAAEN
jgi:hypothetical protein